MATLPDKPVSSSLNDTGTEDSDSDSDEGTLAARKRQLQAQIMEEKKMKNAPAPSPAPAKDVLSVDATGSLEGTCTWTIPHFCTMKVDKDGGKSSDIFSIGGHKWKLYVYPMGRDSGKDKFVSLYLQLADDTKKLPKGWQVPVFSTFSVICQHDPKKSHKEDGEDIFNAVDKTWGWNDFIPLLKFYDVDNGFLVNDTMIIKSKMEVKAPEPAPASAPPKADVQNTKAASAAAPSPAPAKEVVSVNAARRLDNGGAYTWRIPNFSKLKWIDYDRETSDTFSIGGHKWKLCVYLSTPPQGRSTRGQKSHEKNKSLSLSLVLADTDKLPKDGKVTANLCLSVTCQRDPEGSRKVETKNTFTAHFNSDHWEWNNIIPLTDLRDPKRGYLVKDTMIIEAKIDV